MTRRKLPARKRAARVVRVCPSSPDERQHWQDAATTRGVSLSEWMREAANAALLRGATHAALGALVADVVDGHFSRMTVCGRCGLRVEESAQENEPTPCCRALHVRKVDYDRHRAEFRERFGKDWTP